MEMQVPSRQHQTAHSYKDEVDIISEVVYFVRSTVEAKHRILAEAMTQWHGPRFPKTLPP